MQGIEGIDPLAFLNSDIPPHIPDEAKKAGLTRKSKPIEVNGIKNVRTPLYDWDKICGRNYHKKYILKNDDICIQLVMRAFPYDPYDLSNGAIELATMGEKWSAGIKIMSDFYDRDKKLFKLWLEMNLIDHIYFIYQYMGPFEVLFETLGNSYIKVKREIKSLRTVHSKYNMLYNKH